MLHGLEHGFKLKYSGPRLPNDIPSQSITGEKVEIARAKIEKEIGLGRIAGPFQSPPFPTFRVSPIAVIPKKASSEFRLIHNLSFPENESVNDYIDKDFCSVKYASIDDAIEMIYNLGKNALLSKCDIKSAFRLLRLAPSEFDLMGFKFQDQYYFDRCLPMGASISSALFETFSTALHWYVQRQSKSNNILHYLDDFLFGGKSGSLECKNTLETFQNSCQEWGVPLAEKKTVEPTEILTFLGIEFDTKLMIMRLPDDKIVELKKKLTLAINSKKLTLREFQSLIGSLNFACQAIVTGRAFCRRLIDATCHVTNPRHRIRVTNDIKSDLKIWLSFLTNYNGTTVILDRFWVSNSDLDLFTDSAAGKGRGFGIYFGSLGKWAQACWPDEWESLGLLTDITFLELFPVMVALSIWGEHLRNKRVLFHVDNQSCVVIINKFSSKSPRVMSLVRKIVFSCLKFNILIKGEHISGVLNTICDSLSRSDFQKFRRLCPTADPYPSTVPCHLWNL